MRSTLHHNMIINIDDTELAGVNNVPIVGELPFKFVELEAFIEYSNAMNGKKKTLLQQIPSLCREGNLNSAIIALEYSIKASCSTILSMEEEEVSLVDGVFEGALGALALEMEALVDAMEVYGG
ncbi:hypothetical protein Tco_0696748 [Tanacetum coccineum]